MIGQPRSSVDALPAYRPGKAAAQAEEEHGITDAIKLASNEAPWGPVDSVTAAIAEHIGEINRYADHRATPLRERIAEWRGVDAAQVTVGCGSVEIIQRVMQAFVDPGDDVVYPWRSFEVYPVFTQLAGGRSIQVPLDGDTFDLDAVADALTERTKVVLLANPNNPTGTALSTDQLRPFLDRVPDDVIVVLDEAYHEFKDPALGDGVTDLLPGLPNLLVLRTFSKAQGLAALRAGYAIGHPDLITTIDKPQVPFSVNGLAQFAAIASIDADDEVMTRVADILAERDRVVAALTERGYRLPDTQANFVWLPLGDRTEDVALELEKAGVVTRPFPGDGLRVTIGTPEQNDKFLAAL